MTRKCTTFTALLLALTIPACGGRVTTPQSTNTPRPTTTPAKPITLEPVEINLTPYQNNPVLAQGAPGTWDGAAVFSGHVILENGLYHMFYNGSPSSGLQAMAIGYATSPDGLSFTKHASSPILAADEHSSNATQVGSGIPLVEDNTWILYYNTGSRPGPGPAVGRATAAAPSGPWTKDGHAALVVGSPGEWDAGFVMADSVIATGAGYVMYYSGGASWPGGTSTIGLATSPDGITWTKHDNPSTTGSPFAESDPVLQPGSADSWDSAGVWGCTVLETPAGWEMFYTGSDSESVQIGYATSSDGVHWSKYRDNPILVPETDPVAAEAEPLILQSPSAVVNDSTYVLYYDYGISIGKIGVATGTIARTP